MKTPSEWLELSVEAPPEFVEPLSQIFLRYGNGGVAVEEDSGYSPDEGEVAGQRRATIRTYVPMDSTAPERRSQIDIAVRLVASLAPVSALTERVLQEEEWQTAWKRYFKPLHVGKNLVVRPSWLEDIPEDGEVTIWLDPGMAFGTGRHPTTRMCLAQIEQLVTPGARVIDVGCGSGILSIAAARVGASEVVGLDLDPVAIEVARQNAVENQVSETLSLHQGSLPSPRVDTASFDLAVANISAKVVTEIAHDLAAAVRPGGAVIASGVLAENQDSVRDALTAAGAVPSRSLTEDGWVVLVATV